MLGMKLVIGRRGLAAKHSSSFGKYASGNTLKVLGAFLTFVTMVSAGPAVDQAREHVVKIVTQIQRADYEGDRAALKRLYAELAPFVENKDLAVRVRYWRGFVLWRRAINGFNDNVAAAELQEDLKQALDEFDEAAKKDPTFVDARIGQLSCVGLLGYSLRQSQGDPARIQELIVQARQLWKDIEAAAPAHPRALWVMGPNLWYVPVERGGGQTKAMAMYDKGLETIRNGKTTASDPLEPSWGEPELLMNLAWSNLNRTTPDLNAAEQYARSALQLVWNWHYVRDILMPQIQAAKKKTGN